MRARTALLTAALLLSPGIRADADTLHTIELRHRPAAEVLPLIRPLLARGDGASGSGFLLFIRTDPHRLKEIERVLATVDVAARNLTITVRQGSAREIAESRHEMTGHVEIGDRAAVQLPDHAAAPDGLRVRKGNVTYRAQAHERSHDQVRAQTLRVQDGQRAYVRIGQSIPHVQKTLVLGGRSLVLHQGMAFEDATTGFDVQPRVRGETVHIEITPRVTTSRTPEGVVSFHELRTTVAARLGEWIDLGEILGSASDVHREILAAGRTSSQERHSVLLRVD